jgi:stalled ribosome alternative rescue factor ArfA
MKDQRVVGKHKNNPIAKQLSDPLWKMRVVESKVIYNRKIKHKRNSNVDNSKR